MVLSMSGTSPRLALPITIIAHTNAPAYIAFTEVKAKSVALKSTVGYGASRTNGTSELKAQMNKPRKPRIHFYNGR